MKHIMISRSNLIIFNVVVFLLMLISSVGNSQTPTYELRIANESHPTPNIYEFEVFLLRTGATVFELQAFQLGLGWDTTILMGGTTTYSIVTIVNGNPSLPAPSELNASQVPQTFPAGTSVTTNPSYPGINFRYFNFMARTPPGAGNGTIISNIDGGCTHPGTRVGRFRITNSVAFRSNSTCKHVWSIAGSPGRTNTIINAYIPAGSGGNGAQITVQANHLNYNSPGTCIIQPEGIILNPTTAFCFNPPTSNGGGPYNSCNGFIQLNGAIGGSATSGTWSSPTGGTFSPNANSLSATYALSASDIANGSVTLTLTSNNPLGSPCTTAVSNSTVTYSNINDGNLCTIDACNSSNGVISHTAIPIDDGNACTIDNCNTSNQVITHTNITIPNDNNACTFDACNTVNGNFIYPLNPAIDDNNLCTTDYCNTSSGIITHDLHAYLNITDSSICAGQEVKLTVENVFGTSQHACSLTELPSNLRTGLVAYYPFCGNPSDLSGNGHNGSVVSATLTTDRFGNANSAYDFSGSGTYINVSHQFFNNGWLDYSISFWFNPTSYANPPNRGQTLINTNPHNGFAISYNFNNNRHLTHLKNSNPSNSSWNILYQDSFNIFPIDLNNWMHIVIVKSGLTYKYYVNGILDKVVNTATIPASSMCSIRFGATSCCDGENFIGKIDDIAIYNRSLSFSDIQQLNQSLAYSWSTGSIAPELLVTPLVSTKYFSNVTQNGITCIDSASINVIPTPLTANAGGPYVSCSGTIRLNGTVGGGATGGTWYSPTGGTFSPSTNIMNAVYTPSAADLTNGSVVLSLTSNKPNNEACPGFSQATLIFNILDDQDLCTDDACNTTTGIATHTPIPGIDDGNACTKDICSFGSIFHQPAPEINDGNICTEDACNSVTGITHIPYSFIDDNNICTSDLCNSVSGVITHPPSTDINDNNECTVDGCNSTLNVITHDPLSTFDDNDACTIDACNTVDGIITHSPIAGFNDGNPCTIDGCNAASGIITHSQLSLNNDTAICTLGQTLGLSWSNTNLLTGTICTRNDLQPGLRSGLVAYYSFCGNANDESGNGNNGTVANATLTTDRYGNLNSAYAFNGTNSYIDIPNHFFNNGWTNYTISFWFKESTNVNTTGVGQSFINTNPHNGFALVYNYNNSERLSHFKNSNPAASTWDIMSANNFNYNPVVLNVWTHVVVIKTGLTYTYYINGVQDKIVNASTNASDYFTGLRFGGITCCDLQLFKGSLDDITIYNRSLSNSEIQKLNQGVSFSWSTGATTPGITVSPSQQTIYTCTVVQNGNTCADNVIVNVGQNYSITNNAAICQGSSYNLPWNVTVTTAGNYSHLYKTVYGCDSLVTIHLVVNPKPIASMNPVGSVLLCNGVSMVFTATTGPFYLWSNGATTQSITVTTAGNYTVTVSNTFGCSATSPANIVTASACQISLQLKVYIEGFYRGGGLMIAAWDPINLTNISDVVRIDLRNSADPYDVISSDESFIGIDGTGWFTFPSQAFGNSYYIAVVHRNSIETWSKLPVMLGNLTTYDFTTSSSQAFDNGLGTLPMKLVDINPNRWAMYSGDINQDGTVDSQDMTIEEMDSNAAAYGYNASDVDGDFSSGSLDMSILENNSNLAIFTSHP